MGDWYPFCYGVRRRRIDARRREPEPASSRDLLGSQIPLLLVELPRPRLS